jgi:hypothetical protein
MQNNLGLSLMTTASGMIGGISKAVSSNLSFCSITTHNILEVIFYASLSASVGYIIKLSFDTVRKIIINKKKH